MNGAQRLMNERAIIIGRGLNTQIAFKPDWTKHAKAAPFKRNDQMLEALPIGVIAFPGSEISANLADKARKLPHPRVEIRRGRRVSAALLEWRRLTHRRQGRKKLFGSTRWRVADSRRESVRR
jgi:hypothetical protein